MNESQNLRTKNSPQPRGTTNLLPGRSGISNKVMLTFTVILLTVSGILILVSSYTTRNNLEREAEHTMIGYMNTYQAKINSEASASEALAISIAVRDDVQQLYLEGNRDGLFALLDPMFQEWKQRQVVHLYVENPDGTVFLRVHNPGQFGDDITYRATANDALLERTVKSGIEIGPSRIGIRGVSPIFSTSTGEFIGLAEVGQDFDQKFITSLKEETSADFTIWVTYDAAATPNLKPAEGVPAAPIENVFFYVSSIPEVALTEASVYRNVLETGAPAFRILRDSNPPSALYVAPLLGYDNKIIGLIQISEPYTENIIAQNNALLVTFGVVGGLAALSLLLIYLFTNRLILTPVNILNAFAEKQTSGDSKTRVSIQSGDEFEKLASTFNFMADTVERERETLESRVAERTYSLELAADVGRSVSQVRELGTMLQDAAEIIRSRFDLYYVQTYLTNPAGTVLHLRAGTGTVGEELLRREHQLPVNSASINGRAAIEKRSVVISDTISSATFRPNPLLPETQSEMAVPLMLGENVVGVLDLQSRQAGYLNQDLSPAFEALAGQLAVAIQNARLLDEAEQARAEVEAQAGRLVRSNWEDYLNAIHKPERTGYIFEGGQVKPLDEEQHQESFKTGSIAAPIAFSGETLGSLVVEMTSEDQTPQNAELVNIVARQVAQQIENIRLLESAERYRLQAEETTRRATIEGWKEYIAARPDASLGYLYDSNQVVPTRESADSSEGSIAFPLKAGDETIGKLSVMEVDPNNSEALDLANAVVERLGAHIENLRLLEETRRGQVELDKRARELTSVAEISSVSARELDIQKMLETVVFLTQRKFALYHCHVFTFDEQTGNLSIVACGWKEGDEHEGTHGTTIIPIDQEQSLVARAARERHAVVVNNVRSDPGWLPNPLLPDTQSEMALPLLVGDQLLGVLDVQRAIINGFTEEDVAVKTTLAAQIATALQNAYSFSQAQQQAEREAMLNTISQKIQSATTVEAVLQIAARELGHALGAPLTVAQLGVKGGNGHS